MIIQVGGSISFAPEDDGQAAKWLSDDTRHMLAELDPKPDQVTVAINTTQMNIMELLYPEYLEGTSLAHPAYQAAYSEMTVPAGPAWVEEHLRRLQAANVQPHFQLTGIHALETLDRLVRKGAYKGPLNLTWIGIGGGFDGTYYGQPGNESIVSELGNAAPVNGVTSDNIPQVMKKLGATKVAALAYGASASSSAAR